MDKAFSSASLGEKLAKLWDDIQSRGLVESVDVPIQFSYERCPDCQGMGYFRVDVPVGDPRFGKLQRCTNPDCSAAQEIARRALRNYELPREYQGYCFETWESIPIQAQIGKLIAFQAAALFAEHPAHEVNGNEAARLAGYGSEGEGVIKNSLAFFGEPGVGKTGLVASIMNEISRRRRVDILYRRTSDLFLDLQSAFDDKEKAEAANELSFSQRIQRYKQAGVLVLDEWRMQKQTEPRLQWMEDIVRYRHGNRLPTLFTTNLDPESIYDHWKPQTADVALEMAHWIEVKGEKLRQTRSVFREF